MNKEVNMTKWHRLDNNANIYPAISGKNLASVYRVAAILKEPINPEILQIALEKTLKYFAAFKVRLKHGFFWSYFETNNLKPIIIKEINFPCRYLDPKQNNLFLFQVSYYEKTLNLEIFHALTDATGSFRFLLAICYEYILLANAEDFTEKERDEVYGISYANDTEDSYVKNYVPTKRPKLKTLGSQKAFTFKGSRFPLDAVGQMHGRIPTEQILTLCKQKQCSVTQYLTTCLFWGIYTETLNRTWPKKSVNIFVPINLRPYFGSTTSLNFFSGMSIRIDFTRNDMTFEEILDIVKIQFKEKLTKKAVVSKLAYTVGAGYSFPIRLIPLPIKRVFLKVIYNVGIKSNTMSFSNIGRMDIIPKFQKYFENFSFLMTASKNECTKSSAISFGDIFSFTISSVLENTNLQKAIYRKMVTDGLSITLESNGVYNETL